MNECNSHFENLCYITFPRLRISKTLPFYRVVGSLCRLLSSAMFFSYSREQRMRLA